MDQNNGRIEYGKIIEKVDTIQKILEENKAEIKEINKNINLLQSREQYGCEYSHLIEKRVHNIELWKENLSGKIYVFIAVIIAITNFLADKILNLFQ